MKTLFEIDLKNYDKNAPRIERPSVRGIIKSDKIALVHSLKYNYYKFPGGGSNKNETQVQTLIREIKEETGLVVIPASIKEYGMVSRIQKGDNESIFVQDNFYYTCDVEDVIQVQNLDDNEDEEKFTLEFVTLEQAIETNRTHHHGKMQNDKFYAVMIDRDSKILELLPEK